ncbi:MAG: V-type ATP synthase subunit C [Halobacteriales archaeon]
MSAVQGASNYEYVSARVRTRRAQLFGADDYRKLVRMGPGEIARFMEESTYEREMNALGARYDGVDLVEYALNHNLARHFDDLLRWADGRLYDRVARYLRKFDAWNVKTVLRGIYTDTDPQAVADDLIRAGELGDDRLDALLEADSMEQVVERLGDTIFGPPLADALRDYEETGLLVPLENAVDRAYYEHLLADVGDPDDRATTLYLEFLEAEIDFRNLRNALRLAYSGADIDPAEYYIDGGALFDRSELASVAGSVDELVGRVRESRYGDELGEALDELETAESLIGFERALEAALLAYSRHLSVVYPLSVCPVLAFVLAKEREVDNIRAIARGREAGLAVEEIESELVIA